MNTNNPAVTAQAVDDIKKRKLLHDLRGPLQNVSAFNKELSAAIENLCDVLSDGSPEVSAAMRLKISNILHEDLTPCCSFVESAVLQMQERLDQYSS